MTDTTTAAAAAAAAAVAQLAELLGAPAAPAAEPTPAAAGRTYTKIDGTGGGICDGCGTRGDYLWLLTFTDGSYGVYHSNCLGGFTYAEEPVAPAVPEGVAPLPARGTAARTVAPLVDAHGFEYDMTIDDTAVERFDADGLEDTSPADEPFDWAAMMADQVNTIAPIPARSREDNFLILDDPCNTLF